MSQTPAWRGFFAREMAFAIGVGISFALIMRLPIFRQKVHVVDHYPQQPPPGAVPPANSWQQQPPPNTWQQPPPPGYAAPQGYGVPTAAPPPQTPNYLQPPPDYQPYQPSSNPSNRF